MTALFPMPAAELSPLISIVGRVRSAFASPTIFPGSSAPRSYRRPLKTQRQTRRQAVENAKANAAANGVENAEFICADAGKAAEELATRGLRPDTVVVDPPRKGMDEAAVQAVCSMSPECIVYVSCDPATLARDLFRFSSLGYSLREVTAVDMFPRTRHVECVVRLTRTEVSANI